MPRSNLSASMISAFSAPITRPVLFFEAEFISSTYRFCTAARDLTWDSKSWLGNGYIQQVSRLGDSLSLQAAPMTVRLSGVPSALISAVLGDAKKSGTGKVWLGFLDSSYDVIADPLLRFSGRLNVPSISKGPSGSNIELLYEGGLINFRRLSGIRATHENQQDRDSSDLGFEYRQNIANKTFFWGLPNEPSSLVR